MATRLHYLLQKALYSADCCLNELEIKPVKSKMEIVDVLRKYFNDKLTFLLWNNGEEMFPTLGAKGSLLLVRKLRDANPSNVFIGDVVVFKNPEDTDDCLVRRLVAIEGCGMVSNDEKDEPFVPGKYGYRVLADNKTLKPEEAKDSRIFGPVPMTSITGRVIYCLRNNWDHGPVVNSPKSTIEDSPVLQFELDVDEMANIKLELDVDEMANSHKG